MAAPYLPPPKNGTLRQAAQACVQHLHAVSASPVNLQSAKERPLPDSSSALTPSNLLPLARRIRTDLQIVESEFESPEKEILRSPPFPENSPSPISPCTRSLPSPAPLVFTPSPVPLVKSSCSNCEAEMTPDHQCRGEYFYLSRSQWLLHYFFLLVQLYSNQVFRAEILVRNSSA